MSNIAECPDCGKRYKVPHFDQEWSCKVCEVALIPEGEEFFDDPAEESEQPAAPHSSGNFHRGALTNAEQREFRKRSREAGKKSASRRNLLVGIGLLLLVFGGGGTIFAMTRGRTVESAVEQFRESWNQGNYEQVAQLAQEENVERWFKNFTYKDKKKGWNGKPPTLGKHIYQIDGMPSLEFKAEKLNGKRRGAVLVSYESEDGFLTVEFGRRQGAWCLAGMDYSRFE